MTHLVKLEVKVSHTKMLPPGMGFAIVPAKTKETREEKKTIMGPGPQQSYLEAEEIWPQ